MTRAADTQTTACLPTGSQWLGVQFSLGWPMLKIYPVRRALVWAGARFFWSRFWFVLLSCKLLKWLPWSENKVEVNARRFSKILRNIFIRKLSFDNRPSFTLEMCDLVAITGISNVLQYLLVARWLSVQICDKTTCGKGGEGQTGHAKAAVSRAGAIRWVAKVTELM